MKSSIRPLLLLLIPVLIFSAYFIANPFRDTINTPYSSKNRFRNQLEYSLQLSSLNHSSLTFRDYLNQVEFNISLQPDTTPVKVIFSTQKNPIYQVASLQKLFKLVKMKGKQATLVDLSLPHPYVTLKNN